MQNNNIIHTVCVPGAQFDQHIGKLYVITTDFVEFESIRLDGGAFHIEPVQIADFSDFKDEALASAVAKEGATFISLVEELTEDGPVFMMEKVSYGTIPMEAIYFSYQAFCKNRRFSFDSDDSDEEDENDSEFRGRKASAQETAAIHNKALTTFVEDVLKERDTDDSVATRNINLVINRLPESTKLKIIRKYMDGLGESQLQEFVKEYVDLNTVARSSKVKIIVRRRNTELDSGRNPTANYEDVIGTNGEYRICYQYGDEAERPFKFPNRAEYALYLCCLLERRFHGDAPVVFDRLKNKYIGAYLYIYSDMPYSKAEAAYNSLSSDGFYQGRMKDYIKNIRTAIDEELLSRENTAIFYYKRDDYLRMLPEKIILPDGIEEDIMKLGAR